MIGSIRGTVIQQSGNTAIIETASGVGYKVFIGGQLLTKTEDLRLYTYHHVREDSDDLYGFTDGQMLELFEMLLSVSGVGPKMAQNILTTLGKQSIIESIGGNQPAVLRSVSGVGQKVAEKIIVELKSKIGSLPVSGLGGDEGSDLFDALVGLGYRPPEIIAALKEVDTSASMGDRLKQALRLLAQ
jgi:Holliday junction DNA helicase RuvA